jgi:RNA polymerase-binding protein DksA
MGISNRRTTSSPILARAPRTQGLSPARQLIWLLRERRELLKRGRQARDVTPDPLDAAKEVEEEQLWLAVLDRRDEIRDQIREAVELVSEGRYGQCVECNMPIPTARLQALPFAVRCLACQERVEGRRNGWRLHVRRRDGSA